MAGATRERAARALAAMAYAAHFPDDPGLWDDHPDPTPGMRAAGDRLRESYLSRSRPYADAVLAVAADVDEIAGAINQGSEAFLRTLAAWDPAEGPPQPTLRHHQAEAVAAHILGRP